MVGPPLTSPDELPPPDQLATLRRSMRKVRQALCKEGLWRAAPLDPLLLQLISKSDVIGLYEPLGGEPDPASIPIGLPKVTSRPALTDEDLIVFRHWRMGDPQVPSPWGGSQPPETSPIVHPDIVFVPLVAFDSKMNRLGQGGGHYDRYLSLHENALRVGIAWDAQRVDALPVRAWDMPLDAVITEQRCYMKELRLCLSR
jgi:5-formyltetrahydrofolate cyclo-ligase